MARNAHLTLSDRIAIEVGLRRRKCFSAIATELGKNHTAISKEVRTHINLEQAGGYNLCIIHRDCKRHGNMCNLCKFVYGKSCNSRYQIKCFETCSDFQPHGAPKWISRRMSAMVARNARVVNWNVIFMKLNLLEKNEATLSDSRQWANCKSKFRIALLTFAIHPEILKVHMIHVEKRFPYRNTFIYTTQKI